VVRGKKIAIWGLAFKPNTDDVRFAPSIALVKSLVDEGAHVRAYDPEAMEKAKSALPEITYCSNPYEAAEGADAIVIVTEWDEFRGLEWDRLLSSVEQPLVIDGRNVFHPGEISRNGFRYVSIGRADTSPCQSAVSKKMDSSSPLAGNRVREVSA
jgi:UDPglucose 6-dehydrogenase